MVDLDAHVHAVRRFNRFYTKQIGVLGEALAESPFTLGEGRVLYELAHRKNATAAELARDLSLDEGYLSRLLRGLVERGALSRKPSGSDGRINHLSLTPRGAQAFAALNLSSHEAVRAMIEGLAPAAQGELIASMHAIETLLSGDPGGEPYRLREHRPGDMGWVAQIHGSLYHREYGWDMTFEALVAEIVAKFVRDFDPRFERCWIAERHGRNVGSVFCVRDTAEIAKLRLLIVEPSARRFGIGHRLVDECISFARERGYRKLVLWTNDVLHAAQRIYRQAGFVLVEEERHRSFGADLVGQNWELEL